MRMLLLGILWLGVSCDSCRNLDCIPRFDSFQFTYVDANSNNLFSGIAPKYEIDDVEVYSFDLNQNKVFANLQPVVAGAGVINVQLNYSTERSFLEINGEVKDTLDFTFKIDKTECCGEVSEITKTMLNEIVYTGGSPIEIVERN